MLYRLNLTSLESFNELLEKAEITIDYRPYSNFIDICSDREALTARNQRDILNITSLVNSINKVKEKDIIWIKYKDNYVLAEVLNKISLDKNNAKIKFICKNHLSESTPKVIQEIFDDVKFAVVNDDNILSISLKMLTLIEKKEKTKACEMEFIKSNRALVEVSEKNFDIMPYENKESLNTDFLKFLKDDKGVKTQDSGEIIIKKVSEDGKANLPVKVEDKNEMESTKDFYINLMEKQVGFYMDLQRETMDNFLKMEEELWEKFFELMK